MSKYYKVEDVIRAIAEQLCWEARTEYGDKFTTEDWLEEAEDYVSDLPTIEVMEYPQVEGITPTLVTIEVSEDCISREFLEQRIEFEMLEDTEPDIHYGWNKALEFMSKVVKNAPSVVPSRAEGEKRKTGMMKKRIDKPFRMVWLDDELNEIGSSQTDCGAKMGG